MKRRSTDPRFQALARELRVWEQLDHPNVLSLVGFYLDKESLDCAWLITWWQSEGDILGFIDRTKADDNKRLQLVCRFPDRTSSFH